MKLPKTYDPGQYEADIYALWEESGAFKAHPENSKPKFSISMPPPNETGTLSIGHALFLTLQDIMVRHARQKGKDALWLPGTDHAAIAVNAIMEKQLSEEGTDKHEIGRKEFLKRTEQFVAGSRETMTRQMRAMGASCDWSRFRYTLDDSLNRAVSEVFVSMYDDGLIYRGNRIVNWDPNLQTTISDDEITYQEEKTKFYTFKYGPFEIGTARPETKFGDKYVVMHPDDKRYADYKHGDTFEAEWINGPVTATVIKDASVDPEFGTGVMTITPWHDHTDFEIAERHGLDKEQIIDFDGKLMEIAGEFAGMPIADAREKIVDKLDRKGLLVKTDKDYVHNIALNDRGKGVVEPQIKLQWFVDVNKPAVDWKGKKLSLKQVMQSVVREGDIKIVPRHFEKTYFNWIDNLRDWCVSRQIWWGHQIPVWYKQDGKETYVGTKAPKGKGWQRDEDTLDTWFSSALWTWSTLIDPKLADDYSLDLKQLLERSKDFQAYHPTTVMETGWDIIFFWVARMILSTTYATGQVPFKTVYLHGMVRAEDGKKMSKSRPESIIDPLTVIPQYGTDALRLALVMGVSPGNDQNWGTAKAETNRNFCNKLWNIARYVESKSDDFKPEARPESLADHWILAKLNHFSGRIGESIENFNFSGAYFDMYHLIWDDVADWYVEAGKHSSNPRMLDYVLATVLKLAHPFAPFVTETIWQTLNPDKNTMLIKQAWPEPAEYDDKAARQFEEIRSIIIEVRQLKTTLNLTGGELRFAESPLIFDNAEIIKRLSKLESVSSVPGHGIALTQTKEKVWLDIDEGSAKKLAGTLEGRTKNLQKIINNLNDRLDNPSYVKNAPQALVDETKRQLKEAGEEQLKIKDLIKRL